MAILLFFAFISGIITILSPCILPILPVILAGGVGGKKTRSFGIVLGFVISFTFFTLALTTIVRISGISPDILRIAAVIIIILFGLVLVVPAFHEWFGRAAARITNLGRSKKQPDTSDQKKEGIRGLISGLPVGFSLGLVWAPCVGPIMASVITLALTQSLDTGAVFITLAYSFGTAIPMLLIMLTGRTLLNRVPFLLKNSEKIQKVFGVLMILIGISIGFNLDRQFQAALLRVFPDYGTGLTKIETLPVVQDALDKRFYKEQVQNRQENNAEEGEPGDRDDQAARLKKSDVFSYSHQPKEGILKNYGKAPEIVTNGAWFNSLNSLSMNDLLGKVVLIDFWTYSCINCIRTIPYLRSWYDKYQDQGFIVIGVHTPEFEFEKNKNNVMQAIKDLGVNWPVVLDNEYRQWLAYANRYWPAHYFIDAQGNIRYFHFGEGHYDTSEKVIQALLKETGKEVDTVIITEGTQNSSKTPETYLGYGREEGFLSGVPISRNKKADYRPAENLKNGMWTLEGEWVIAKDYIVPEYNGNLRLSFHAKNVYLVIEPEEPGGTIVVRLDGVMIRKTKDINNGILAPDESRLYELIRLSEAGLHTLDLEINGRLRLFAFTFG